MTCAHTDMAVDAALSDPSSWTPTTPGPTTDAPPEVRFRTPKPEQWLDMPGYPLSVSTRGRVWNKVTGQYLRPVGQCKGKGYRVGSKGDTVWVPKRAILRFIGWEG